MSSIMLCFKSLNLESKNSQKKDEGSLGDGKETGIAETLRTVKESSYQPQ